MAVLALTTGLQVRPSTRASVLVLCAGCGLPLVCVLVCSLLCAGCDLFLVVACHA